MHVMNNIRLLKKGSLNFCRIENVLSSIVSVCDILCHIVLGAVGSTCFTKPSSLTEFLFFKHTLLLLVRVLSFFWGWGRGWGCGKSRTCFPSFSIKSVRRVFSWS